MHVDRLGQVAVPSEHSSISMHVFVSSDFLKPLSHLHSNLRPVLEHLELAGQDTYKQASQKLQQAVTFWATSSVINEQLSEENLLHI
jgi:hypothetical protein